ncbi:hypothetical protein RFI_14799 [Reticulomyxa filosa]|uniref:Agenet-like domain-containing protein n=1 Tax=Reticulomyxa filosa TaxID=46433 RepID=X6N9J7_RETFI|nr:hypothetical protein RFI_14799 [Reticulomyxa filosa]|eukprot:ETO22399.1 hypothetical protein RFI_14799 [Reticulomyxa filosa]
MGLQQRLQKELARFAKAQSISRRPGHRLKHLQKGDLVDICPKIGNAEGHWYPGEIHKKDKKSGQVQVVYEADNKNCLTWVHVDDIHAIAEFASKSSLLQTCQISVEQYIQGKHSKVDTLASEGKHDPHGFPCLAKEEALCLNVDDLVDFRLFFFFGGGGIIL